MIDFAESLFTLIGISLLPVSAIRLFRRNLIPTSLSSDIGIGFAFMALICSILGWTLGVPEISRNVIYALSLFGIIATWTVVHSRKTLENQLLVKINRYKVSAKVLSIVTVTLVALLSSQGLTSFRYYVNPDTYGYMNLKGALETHKTFPNILEHWEEYSGRNFSFGMNWDRGSTTLESLWQVPNFLLRYSVDALNIPRIGLPSFLAFMTERNDVANAFVLWNAFSCLGLVLIMCVAIELTLITAQIRLDSMNPVRFQELYLKGLKPFLGFLVATFMTLVLSSPLGQTLLFEGFAAQLFAFALNCVVLLIMMNSFSFDAGKSLTSLIFPITIVISAGYFIYLQQLPFLFLTIAFGLLLPRVISEKKLISKVMLSSQFVVILGFGLSFLLPGTLYLIRQIGGGTGHGAVHLGTPTFWNFMSLSFLDKPLRYERISIINNFAISKPVGDSGVVLTGQKIGHVPFINSPQNMLNANLVLVVTILAISLFISKQLKMSLPRVIYSTIPLIAIVSYNGLYLWSNLVSPLNNFSYTRNVTIKFNDYVWLRSLSLQFIFLILSISVFLGLAYVGLISRLKRNTFQRIRISIFATVLILSFNLTFEYSFQVKQFVSVSVLPWITQDCKRIDSPGNIYTWNDNSSTTTALSIGLCGRDYFGTNDSFRSQLPTTRVRFPVKLVQLPKVDHGGAIEMSPWRGSLSTLPNPCDLVCMSRMK